MNKQPKALSIFFLTEMWERYGFNMLEILLVIFLISVFSMGDTFSYTTLGSVTALAYINSIVGGYLADRFLGHRRAVLVSALILSASYAVLACSQSMTQVFWSLSLVTLGTGMLKPNVSSMVGSLYKENDVRRHGGFTLFYIGINAGIMLGLLIPSYLQTYFSWAVAFSSGAVMLLVGFFTFYLGGRYFKIKDFRVFKMSYRDWFKVMGILAITLVISYETIAHPSMALLIFLLVAVVALGVVIYQAFRERGRARARLWAYFFLLGISVIYWAVYFQIFFSMNLFVDRAVSHHFLGFNLTTGAFAAVESVGVMFFGAILGKVWTVLGRSRWNPSTPMKFALGMLMHTAAFGLLFLSSRLLGVDGFVRPDLVILVYLIIAIGELLLSPTGLSMVTELVPERIVGMMMGIFFITLGLGGKLAGIFADWSAIPRKMTDVTTIEHIYSHAFLTYFLICLVAMVISFALVPLIKRLIATPKTVQA